MRSSRFWLRRSGDDQGRQLVFEEVPLERFSERQRRAILRVLSRNRTASHSEVAKAVQRTAPLARREAWVTTVLAIAAGIALAICLLAWHHGSKIAKTPLPPLSASRLSTGYADPLSPTDPAVVMDRADKRWLSNVEAGRVSSRTDGSDALLLQDSPNTAPAAGPAKARNASQR